MIMSEPLSMNGIISVYFDCLTRLYSIAQGLAVNEWWHMFDA